MNSGSDQVKHTRVYENMICFRAHSFTHRMQDDPVACPICEKVFRNKILLSSHKRIHKIGKSGTAVKDDIAALTQHDMQSC